MLHVTSLFLALLFVFSGKVFPASRASAITNGLALNYMKGMGETVTGVNRRNRQSIKMVILGLPRSLSFKKMKKFRLFPTALIFSVMGFAIISASNNPALLTSRDGDASLWIKSHEILFMLFTVTAGIAIHIVVLASYRIVKRKSIGEIPTNKN